MNFTIQGQRVPRRKSLADEVFEVSKEDDDVDPRDKLVAAARKAVDVMAAELGGECRVEVLGHEGPPTDGFRTGHLSVTVSRLDPDRVRLSDPGPEDAPLEDPPADPPPDSSVVLP